MSATQVAQLNEGETMNPNPLFSSIEEDLGRPAIGSLRVRLQSVLSDDAHTSMLPKDLDTNFGTILI